MYSVVGCWIWVIVVMLYMWSLLRYLVVCSFLSWGSKAHCAACFHASLTGVCFVGKSLLVVFMNTSYFPSSKSIVQAMGDLEHA